MKQGSERALKRERFLSTSLLHSFLVPLDPVQSAISIRALKIFDLPGKIPVTNPPVGLSPDSSLQRGRICCYCCYS